MKEKLASTAKLNRVRMAFYQECIKEGLTPDDVDSIGYCITHMDNPIMVMAGIKAGKQRRRNSAGKKAAITRKLNTLRHQRAKAKR